MKDNLVFYTVKVVFVVRIYDMIGFNKVSYLFYHVHIEHINSTLAVIYLNKEEHII